MNLQTLKSHTWARRGAWMAGSVAALWAIGWLAVPPLLKYQAQKTASEKLGRAVTLGAVDFKPWTMELTLTDLAIATADGKADQVRIQRIYIDGELQSLVRMAPVVDAITVDGPVAQLTHLGGGRYDIDDILKKLAPPPDQPPSEPAQFALYNLALNGGSFEFIDNAVGKTHTVRDLRLAVPFLSNLDSKRDVHTDPLLAFKLNGSAFDSSARSTPFAQTRKTDASLKLQAMDLTPYLGYLPATLPVHLQSAVLDADVKLAFEQTPAPAVRLSGTVQISRVKLADAKDQDLLAFDRLQLGLADVRPLARAVKLSSVELNQPLLTVHRARDGRLNLDLNTPPAKDAKKSSRTIAEKDRPALEKKEKESPSSPPDAWKVDVASVAVRGGQVDWIDDTTAVGKGPSARLGLRELSLDATGIALPFGAPGVQAIPFRGSAAIEAGKAPAATSPIAGTATAAGLTFSGSALDTAASMTATVSALPLSLAAPYVAQFLEPTLAGTLNAAVGVNWTLGANLPAIQKEKGSRYELKLRVDKLNLDKLALNQGKAALASVQAIELLDAQIDPVAQSVVLGKLVVTNPKAKIERDTGGRWMVEQWLKGGEAAMAPQGPPQATAAAPKAAASSPVSASSVGATAATNPWKVAVNDFLLQGGTLGWNDAAHARPAAFEVSGLRVALKSFVLDGKKPASLEVGARIGAGRTEPGRLSYRGTVGLNPPSAQGAVDLVNLPVHAFEPYFGDLLNIELLRADASFKGSVQFAALPAGPQLRLSGDSAVESLRANSVAGTAAAGARPGAGAGSATPARAGTSGDEELLAWKALNLRGIDVALAPGAPARVDVRETVLSDFYARVILSEEGRLNLQDLVKAQPGAAVPATPAQAAASGPESDAKKIANNDQTTTGSGQNDSKSGVTNPAPAAAAPAGPAPVINVGPINLVNGRVYFSDRFIKPNYSADLSQLNGKLSAFSSVSPTGTPQLADLELRGRVGATASLDIVGKLNPLAQPLALDIQGKVRDLELAPLTPYSVKYTGHGIERGKLSMDVSYRVQPDGQLTASNNIVLNQLSFGEKVEGSTASLPVKLAVALLADRNGVIDINLPISGSLNDPQFSLGSVILKVIVNLITKAITAPFTLLASAFGGSGGEELGTVPFAPGSAALSAQATAGLDRVAKVLADRPVLIMTVTGMARLDVEREGYKRERLQALVVAEQRRAQGGGTATVTVSPAQYPELLKAVYRRADITKPRNLVGLAKDLPVPEMEALLLADIPVTEESMRELALQRGVAVRDYLATRQLPLERLFLGAPKTTADKAPATAGAATAASGAASGPTEAAWTPRAELALTIK
jgi:uncharacterized protein involved in outer membrane biogenesis